MPQKPQRERKKNEEAGVTSRNKIPEVNGVAQSESQFRRLVENLLAVSPEELREKEREWKAARDKTPN
jgi:hypothetical protein